MVVLYTLVCYYATMLNYQQVRFFANSGRFAHDFALFRRNTHYFGWLVQGVGPPAGQVACGDLGGCAAGSGYAGTPCGRGLAPCTDPRGGGGLPADPGAARPGGAGAAAGSACGRPP